MDFFKTDVFHSYAYYSSLLALKMFGMSFLTAFHRITKMVYINPEDAKLNKVKTTTHESVERVRRAHLNDIENILPFFAIGFLYCCTNPAAATATALFKYFTWARYAHTLVYAFYPVPQPSRVIAFAVGQVCNVYMAYCVYSHFK